MKTPFKALLPFSTPEGLDLQDATLPLRERVLQTSALLFVFYGSVQSIISALSGESSFLAVSLLFTLLSLVLFCLRRMAYTTRAAALLVLIYLLANALFIRSGWNVQSLILMLISTYLSTVLLKTRPWQSAISLMATTFLIWFFLEISRGDAYLPTVLILQTVLALLAGFLGNLILHWMVARIETDNSQSLSVQGLIQEYEAKVNSAIAMAEDQSVFKKAGFDLSAFAASTAEPELLEKQICDLLQHTLNLYYAGVFRLDSSREYAILQYGTGEPGKQMLMASYRLAIGGFSLVGKSIQNRKMMKTTSNPEDPSRFENPFLPDSFTEIALPLLSSDELFGVLDIHLIKGVELSQDQQALLNQAANLLAISLEKAARSNKPREATRIATAPLKPLFADDKEIEIVYKNPAAISSGASKKMEIPLLMREEKIGILELDMGERNLSDEQLRFVHSVADQALQAIDSMQQFEQTSKQVELERKIFAITSKIRSTNDSQQMLQIALEELSRNLGIRKAQIVLNVPESPRVGSHVEMNTHMLTKKPTTGKLPEL